MNISVNYDKKMQTNCGYLFVRKKDNYAIFFINYEKTKSND